MTETNPDALQNIRITLFKNNQTIILQEGTDSEDAAGNVAENTLDTKKQEIGFGVDKTKPNMVVTNLESDTTYPLENLTVSLSAGSQRLLQRRRLQPDGGLYHGGYMVGAGHRLLRR